MGELQLLNLEDLKERTIVLKLVKSRKPKMRFRYFREINALKGINLLSLDKERDASKKKLRFLTLEEKAIIELPSVMEFLRFLTLPTLKGVPMILVSDLL